VVSLRPIDNSGKAVEALSVSASQQQVVAGVADSLVEAVEDAGGRAIYWAIYDDDPGRVRDDQRRGRRSRLHRPVSLEAADRPAVPAARIWHRDADLIVEYFRGRPGVEVMWTSCGEGAGGPLGFYERYGFEQTDDRVFDDEILLRLKIT
jgi:diamine N-acetyltransferase